MHQCHDVATLGAKSGKVQYGKGQQGGEDRKDKRGREDREGDRSREGHWGNKVNSMVRENSSSEANIYHYINYKC